MRSALLIALLACHVGSMAAVPKPSVLASAPSGWIIGALWLQFVNGWMAMWIIADIAGVSR